MHDPQDPRSLGDNYVRAAFEDRAEKLWLSTHGGLSRFDPESEVFTNYTHDPGDSASLSHNSVMAVSEDEDGTLWVATYGGGLNRLDVQTGRFTHLTMKDGLPSNALYSVLPDGDGRLWISSNHGISRFDPRSGTFTNFDVDDGLQSNEFNYLAWFKNARGEMFFGGVNGFNVFHPSEIEPSSFIAPIHLTALKTLDGTSHELRTPLYGITGLAESLADGACGGGHRRGPVTPSARRRTSASSTRRRARWRFCSKI